MTDVITPDEHSKTKLAVTAFIAIALYNVVELDTIIFTTFKKRSGLYFWSFLTAANGVAPFVIGFLIRDLGLSSNQYMYITLIVVGWVMSVSGQSVVLYSRLHLVVRSQRTLRLALYLIIFNGILFHIPTIVLVYGANLPVGSEPWVEPYSVFEKVEVTAFFLQEVFLSGLYIYSTVTFFRLEATLHGKTRSQLMMHLVWINVFIIVLDVTILALEYAGFYELQTAYKGLVYSIKLKLEFKILNSLVDLTKSRAGASGSGGRRRAAGGDGGYLQHSASCGDDDATTAVAMDTFDGTRSRVRRHHHNHKDDGGEVGYKAHIVGRRPGDVSLDDDDSVRGGLGVADGIKVMTTMEVTTTSVGADPWNSREGVDSVDTERGIVRSDSRSEEDGGLKSSSSSEIEFAKRPGFSG